MAIYRKDRDIPSGTIIDALTTGSWTSFTLVVVSVTSGNSVGLLTTTVLPSLYNTAKMNQHHIKTGAISVEGVTFIGHRRSRNNDISIVLIFKALTEDVHVQCSQKS